jgi:hypothetical protein
MLLCSGVQAQSQPSEHDVKAAYLLNYGRYVKWPADNDSTFDICVIGRDPIAAQLDRTVAGESVGGRNVVVKHVNSAREAAHCAILFISSSEQGRASAMLEDVRNKPVLTVGEAHDFLERGGIIQFELQQDRVRFAVNRDAAREAGLTLSSDLLKVATRVEGK